MTLWEKFKKHWRGLPEKKKYLEVITAVLSIPVLTTAIILNVNSLQKKDAKPTPRPSQVSHVTVIPVAVKETVTPTSVACKKEVGPVDIIYPTEGQTVSDNPLCIDLSRKSGDYCSVQWSFKLDDAQWSSYGDDRFCLSNLSSGVHKLQIIVKSDASQDQVLLQRNFTYKGVDLTSPTPATSSATTH